VAGFESVAAPKDGLGYAPAFGREDRGVSAPLVERGLPETRVTEDLDSEVIVQHDDEEEV
jgi:hypothetical protein